MANLFSQDLISRQPLATRLLSTAFARQRLAKAYLFTGRAQEDKFGLAKALISALNCSRAEGLDASSCAVEAPGDNEKWCTNCKWIASDEHPQAWRVLAAEAGKTSKMPVEKAREIQAELTKSSPWHRGLVVDDAAEVYFHRPSANALLKTIEEPRTDVTFFFFALTKGDVLKTVVSRCQVIDCRLSGPYGLWSLASPASASPALPEFAPSLDPCLEQFQHSQGYRIYNDAATLATTLLEAANPETSFAEMLDYVAWRELCSLKLPLSEDAASSKYGYDFLKLCDLAKMQLDHYVSAKAVIESFAFAWGDLRRAYKC